MKERLKALLVEPSSIWDETLVDTQSLYLFRVKLLQAMLLTASIVGSLIGVLQMLHLLPSDSLYTPIVILYGITNFIAYLVLVRRPHNTYAPVMHFAIFSALVTLSIMSWTLAQDEFRLVWFFLLAFAGYMLGGKRYGISVSILILSIVYIAFFDGSLELSAFSIFTFTTSLLTFSIFALFFLTKIEQDAITMQQHVAKEIEDRQNKEQLLQKIQKADIIHLGDDYFWDNKHKKLTHHQELIKLTQKEQSLLSLLIANKNCCVSYEQIQAEVWRDAFVNEISTQSVKLQITQLRKKLPKGIISNVYGCGYTLYV